MNLLILSITLFAAFGHFFNIIQSSAYLTNLCPLRSSSLSSSLSIIFASKGDRGPPCGVPLFDVITTPSTIIPPIKYLWIKDITLPSDKLSDSSCTSFDWFTWSKNFSRSIEATHTKPSFAYSCIRNMASCALLPGLNPKLLSEKVFSYMGVNTCTIACWIILSTTVGIPNALFSPFSFLGISTLRTGFGLYLPASSLPFRYS